MLPLQPRKLALAAGVVLLGGVTAAFAIEPDVAQAPAPTTTQTDQADAEPEPAERDDGSAERGNGSAERDDGSAKDLGPEEGTETSPDEGDGSGSLTDDTLERMLDRDMADAVETYQDAGREEPE